ncbi:MAG TPA: hypothetical protein VMS93_05330 [Candidatus Saccharimonadales bacterium]|nr:hypothetical protein [Candidatus Saccharimonadales bacterium]
MDDSAFEKFRLTGRQRREPGAADNPPPAQLPADQPGGGPGAGGGGSGVADFLARLDRDTARDAEALRGAGMEWSLERALAASLTELHEGYRPAAGGVPSLMLSACLAFERFVTWARLWEMQGRPGSPLPASAGDLLALLANPGGARIQWLAEEAQGRAAAGPGEARAARRSEQEWPEDREAERRAEGLAGLPRPAAGRAAGPAGGGAGGGPSGAPEARPAGPGGSGAAGPSEVVFGRGFYEEGPDGRRWMGREASFTVSARALGAPRALRFELSSAEADCYERLPFQVRLYVGEDFLERVVFDGGLQTREVQLELPKSRGDLVLRLESSDSFVPAQVDAGPDTRPHSVQLGELALG